MAPKKFLCCRFCKIKNSSREDRALTKARVCLKKEANMVDIVKKMRYFDNSIAYMIDKDVRNEI